MVGGCSLWEFTEAATITFLPQEASGTHFLRRNYTISFRVVGDLQSRGREIDKRNSVNVLIDYKSAV